MPNNILIVIISILLSVTFGCKEKIVTAEFEDPTTRNFNTGWEFAKNIDTTVTDDYFSSSSSINWQAVTLPHTANIEPLVISEQQWQGNAFYRKFFEISPGDSRKYTAVRFGAAMHETDIWLNGEKIRKHKGGYLPFVVNLTNRLKTDGTNVLLLKLNNEDNPTIPPGKPIAELDFNYFSGLYRNADLLVDEKMHISDPVAAQRVAAGGVRVHYTDVSREAATVNIQTDIENFDKTARDAAVKVQLKSADGRIISRQHTEPQRIEPGRNHLFDHAINVTAPKLWSPDTPHLYTLTVELIENGKAIDFWQKNIGIRTISFNDNHQFVLNGQPLQLRGTNRHQSYPYIGYALSDNAQYRDAYKIKKAGFNFIRTAHYPPSPTFLEAADELGLLFMNAIPGWQFFGNEEFRKLAYRDIRVMIRRDRNHPSIAIWEASLNESDMPEQFMEKAHEIVHKELPFEGVYTSGWKDHAYDIFIPARQHASPPDYWANYPKKKPLLIAEYGDWEYYAQNAGFNQDAYENLQKEERNSRQRRRDGQKRLAQQALNFHEAHNSNLRGWSFGDANWVMFDYNRGYADNIEASGIRDIFRLPKFANFFYQSQADPTMEPDAEFHTPMIYIANYWFDPDFKTVTVFSNTEEVELFLNEESLGRKSPDSNRMSTHINHPPFTFELNKFEEGTLKATGYIGGTSVVNTKRITPEEPAALELRIDESGKKLEAGKKDVVFLYASVIDINGTVIPHAENSVIFSVEGHAELIGQNPVNAEAGIATIILRAGKKGDKVTVRATSGKLKPAKTEIDIH